MFLIQFKKGFFVNAENIEIIRYKDSGEIIFFTVSDPDNEFGVDKEFTDSFINLIQELDRLNANILLQTRG